MSSSLAANLFQPRLSLGPKEAADKNSLAYLLLSEEDGEKIEIGLVDSAHYRLVQCLFSPENFHAARYNPVSQSIERVFYTIGQVPASQQVAMDSKEKDAEMLLGVRSAVQSLSHRKVGKHLHFTWSPGSIRMEIVPYPAS